MIIYDSNSTGGHPLFLTRCGSGYRNTTLSSLFSDATFGRFNVKCTKTGDHAVINVLPTHSLYKRYSNAGDFANTYMARLVIYILWKTHLFKIRLFSSFIYLFLTQTRLNYNHIWKGFKNEHVICTKPKSSFEFAPLLKRSLKKMIYAKHHHLCRINQTIDIQAVRAQPKEGNFSSFTYHQSSSSPHMESVKCYTSVFGTKCDPVIHICLACSIRKQPLKLLHTCDKCGKKYHNTHALAKCS